MISTTFGLVADVLELVIRSLAEATVEVAAD